MATPLKSYIDRVLNVLSEIDDLGTDKKNVYKELADEGYDRTVVAQVVGHIRKKAKKPGKFAEQSALFDLYLADYEGTGTVVATRTPRANSEDFDPETGEILEDDPTPPASQETTAADPAEGVIASSADHISDARKMVSGDQSTAALTEVPGTAPDHQDLRDIADAPRSYPPEPQQKAAEHASSGSVAGAPAGTQAPPVGTNSEPEGASEGEKPRMASAPTAGEAAAISGVPEVSSSAVPFATGSLRYESTPPVGVVRHEYQRCFPERWGTDLAGLKDDIRANGVMKPILMRGNILLDGWSRYSIARELRIEYPVFEYAGADAEILPDIIRANMADRSLNLVERQAIAKKLIKLAPEREAEIVELLDLHQNREAA